MRQVDPGESCARSRLSCDPAKRSCPDFIRPAGGAACFEYDEGSVDGCAELYASFTSCEDFDVQPCPVSAKSACSAGSGGAGGAADGGGTGGAAPADAGSAGLFESGFSGGAGGL